MIDASPDYSVFVKKEDIHTIVSNWYDIHLFLIHWKWRLENRKTGAEVSVYESWLQNSNRWLCRTWFAGVFGLCLGAECEFHESQATQGDNYCQLPAHRLNDFSFLECGKREGRSYNYINTLRTQINMSDIQRVLCKRVKKVFSSY